MTRASDDQLELDFEGKHRPPMQELASSSDKGSGSVICFASYLRLRRAREAEVEDAKLLERITSRVQHFK